MRNCASSSVAIGVHRGGGVVREVVGGCGLSSEHFCGLRVLRMIRFAIKIWDWTQGAAFEVIGEELFAARLRAIDVSATKP